jgi:hypothetical protein
MSIGFETKTQPLENGAAARERREEIDVGVHAIRNILITCVLNPCDGSPATLRYHTQRLARALRSRRFEYPTALDPVRPDTITRV